MEGIILNNIGTVYSEIGLYPEALEQFQKALVIRREIGDRAGEDVTLNNIGSIYWNQGRYSEALEQYQDALIIQQEIGDRLLEGTTSHNIGSRYHKQGRYTEALEQFQQALVIRREVGDRAGEGQTLAYIGAVYWEQKQYSDALNSYEQAMDQFKSIRVSAGSDSARASFISKHAGLYDLAAELYFQQDQPEKAFYTSERGRARSFLDSLATGYVELSDDTAALLYTQEQEAYSVRQAAQDELVKAKAQAASPDESLIADLEAQLIQAEKEYQAALEAIDARGDQLSQLVPGRSTVLDLHQIQVLLDGQTTLLSYWVLEEQTFAFILTQNSFDAVALPIPRSDLYAEIDNFLSFPNTNTAFPESATALYQDLIEPLKPYLTSPHLVVIPHGRLHYLPFAALTDGSRYLVDDYTITYLPSASSLPFIQQNTGRTVDTLLILGNPDTDVTDLKPLQFAESEAQAIAELFQATPLLGKDATESSVRQSASTAGVIHLAAHGTYNPYNPLYSAIYLAADEENDGSLEPHEVYGLDLARADLVVLSACQSHLGELSSGDELVGLTRAFFFAGTPTVVASLWNVDDETTELLMEKFYENLLEGVGKAQALQQAQIDVRAAYPNPYYWGAFVISGDGERTSFKSRKPENPSKLTSVLVPESTDKTTRVRVLWLYVILVSATGLTLVTLVVYFAKRLKNRQN